MQWSVLEKFLRYVSYDTQSDAESDACPSTQKQLTFLNLLVGELHQLGLDDASLKKGVYTTATLPSNIGKKAPVAGFLAHVDTSPDAPGADVKPQIFTNYDGGDLVLNSRKGITLKVSDFPELLSYKGQTLVTSDGTTLLGADDKAGVAEIMSVLQYLVEHPEFKHGEVKVAFTTDEEVGKGVDNFDVADFGADYAYTFDGGAVGELEFENFNAAEACITVVGRNIHPGYAKGKMLNAAFVAMEFNALLPPEQRPEHTGGYEGFYHLTAIKSNVETAQLNYLIRDHDLGKFNAKKEFLQTCANFINTKYGDNTVSINILDSYYNMRDKIAPHYRIVEIAQQAMVEAGVAPLITPVRGGTDGARLSYMGLPCPNIFAGGHNFHGRFEFIPVESMQKACEVMLNIITLTASE